MCHLLVCDLKVYGCMSEWGKILLFDTVSFWRQKHLIQLRHSTVCVRGFMSTWKASFSCAFLACISACQISRVPLWALEGVFSTLHCYQNMKLMYVRLIKEFNVRTIRRICNLSPNIVITKHCFMEIYRS